MKNKIIFFICTLFMMMSLVGCSDKGEELVAKFPDTDKVNLVPVGVIDYKGNPLAVLMMSKENANDVFKKFGVKKTVLDINYVKITKLSDFSILAQKSTGDLERVISNLTLKIVYLINKVERHHPNVGRTVDPFQPGGAITGPSQD